MKNKHQYSGFPDDCSPEQLEILSKFRQEVRAMGCSDPPYDDTYLLRFLRARKFDLPKTLEMWKNFIQWRKDNNVEQIAEIEFTELNEAKKHYPHFYFRTDKQGRPIYIERMGALKFDQLAKVMPHERLTNYFIQSYERLLNKILPACTRAKGTRVDQTLYIMDLKGAGSKIMSPKMWDLLKMASKIGQDNYPETLGNMFIINAPFWFYGVWNIAKQFVDEKTKKKIHIIGEKFHKELGQYMDINDLPDFLGGKATVAEYGENLTIEEGPWVDSFDKDTNLLSQDTNVEVNRRALNVETERIERGKETKEININTLVEENQARSSPELKENSDNLQDFSGMDDWDVGSEDDDYKHQIKVFHAKPSLRLRRSL